MRSLEAANLSRRFTAAALLVLCTTSASMAGRPTSEQAAAIRSSCRSDYESYCSSIPPGGEASLNCLKQNEAKLSPACQSAVKAATGAPTSSEKSEATPSEQPAKKTGTSQQPAEAAAPPPPMTLRQELRLLRWDCRGDFRRLCRGVPIGGGRIIACFEANRSLLSRDCARALQEIRAQ